MILDALTAKAGEIEGFERLPVTAQISLVYDEIETARKLSIPLSSICSALNKAGSKVTLRYLREALSVVRRRLKSKPLSLPFETIQNLSEKRPDSILIDQSTGKTPKILRQEKADKYTNFENPLLRQFNKEKE